MKADGSNRAAAQKTALDAALADAKAQADAIATATGLSISGVLSVSAAVKRRRSVRAFLPSPVESRLDPASGVPTYLQLVHQVEHALRLGYLKPGDQLPKVRDVVASLARASLLTACAGAAAFPL